MSYKNLIDSGVTLAFNQLKDLAVDATLKKSSTANFNFASAEMDSDIGLKNIPIKAVVLEDKKASQIANSIKRQLMFKTRGLGDLNAYDRIDIPDDSGVINEWRFGPNILNNGYTILAEIYREV